MLDVVLADLGNKVNRLMSDMLIRIQDTEECMPCLLLRLRTEHDSDEDEFDDVVAERNTEEEEAARKMSKLSLSR